MQIYSIKLTTTVYFVDQHQVEELSKYRPTFDVRDIKVFILFRMSLIYLRVQAHHQPYKL